MAHGKYSGRIPCSSLVDSDRMISVYSTRGNVVADVEHFPFGCGVLRCTECDDMCGMQILRVSTPRISPSDHTLLPPFHRYPRANRRVLYRRRRSWCSFWSMSNSDFHGGRGGSLYTKRLFDFFSRFDTDLLFFQSHGVGIMRNHC